jgi:activator of HSP90 ATPase
VITHIHQEQTFRATPREIYDALTDAAQFGEITGAPTEIDPADGGEFSLFGGMITGRMIEGQPARHLVQAWRAKLWGEGAYSLVRFTLAPDGGHTRVTLDHSGFPEGTGEHLDEGWHPNYWEPLRRRFPDA